MTTAERILRAKQDIDEAYDAGKAAGSMDEFWDKFQNYGNRTDYQNAFGGIGWTPETFKPKHPIKPTNAYMMFARSTIKNFDGIDIDFTNLSGGQYIFYNCNTIEEVGVVKATGTLYGAFQNAIALHTVEEIILPEVQYDANYFTSSFNQATKLQNVKFSGGKNQRNIDIHWSTLLTADSLDSIVESLSDDVTGQTITFPTTAESTYNAKYGEGAWATLLSTKQNWSIAYA